MLVLFVFPILKKDKEAFIINHFKSNNMNFSWIVKPCEAFYDLNTNYINGDLKIDIEKLFEKKIG